MTNREIARLRLRNQRIAGTTFQKPADTVAWLGAVQAQDYPGALWAIGLRTAGATEEAIEKAVADRTIVRTWPMRRTLHFVAAADIRWMLELLASLSVARALPRLRQLELDERVLARCKKLFVRALQGGKQLTRNAMYQVLEAAHISTSDYRGLHILSQLAQEGLICFGAREGKQQTFALLDEWVPGAKPMARDEALEEVARRYFTSHGPATLQDFVWWSGLPVADARAAVEMAAPRLIRETIDGKAFWLSSSLPSAKDGSPYAYLLPAFDEYTVAYKDRSAVLDPLYAKRLNAGGGMLNPTMVVDGQVAGTWKRALKKETVVITPGLFGKLSRAETRAFAEAASRYGRFLDAPVVME